MDLEIDVHRVGQGLAARVNEPYFSRLSERSALMLVMMLSIGLWAVIWSVFVGVAFALGFLASVLIGTVFGRLPWHGTAATIVLASVSFTLAPALIVLGIGPRVRDGEPALIAPQPAFEYFVYDNRLRTVSKGETDIEVDRQPGSRFDRGCSQSGAHQGDVFRG